MSPTMFEPDMETPDGWRATPLGALACKFGWHFGQIGVGDGVMCARCRITYWTPGVLFWAKRRYFLPKRTLIIYDPDKAIPGVPWDLRDVFEGYRCLDCNFDTKQAQKIVDHQKQWHNWRKWWKRLKAS